MIEKKNEKKDLDNIVSRVHANITFIRMQSLRFNFFFKLKSIQQCHPGWTGSFRLGCLLAFTRMY